MPSARRTLFWLLPALASGLGVADVRRPVSRGTPAERPAGLAFRLSDGA
jgi:hypothetical protein